MVVDAGKTEGRGIEGGGGLAVGPERLAVQVQLSIEFPRSPAGENLLHRRLIDLERIDEGAQVRRRGDDGADVQIAVGPAVQAAADAGRKGVVDRRMAQRALDS